MKYMKQAGIYKASNVIFNPQLMQAVSYDWWIFVKKIGPLTVFNSYGYSNTTRKHQAKVKTLLRELEIDIHADIESPQGLQNLTSSETWYQVKIAAIQSAIDKPRSQAKKNLERMKQIGELQQKLKQVKHLIKMDKASWVTVNTWTLPKKNPPTAISAQAVENTPHLKNVRIVAKHGVCAVVNKKELELLRSLAKMVVNIPDLDLTSQSNQLKTVLLLGQAKLAAKLILKYECKEKAEEWATQLDHGKLFSRILLIQRWKKIWDTS